MIEAEAHVFVWVCVWQKENHLEQSCIILHGYHRYHTHTLKMNVSLDNECGREEERGFSWQLNTRTHTKISETPSQSRASSWWWFGPKMDWWWWCLESIWLMEHESGLRMMMMMPIKSIGSLRQDLIWTANKVWNIEHLLDGAELVSYKPISCLCVKLRVHLFRGP